MTDLQERWERTLTQYDRITNKREAVYLRYYGHLYTGRRTDGDEAEIAQLGQAAQSLAETMADIADRIMAAQVRR